jgi:hypothetical protein
VKCESMMPKEAFNKSEFTAGVRIQTRNELDCSFPDS